MNSFQNNCVSLHRHPTCSGDEHRGEQLALTRLRTWKIRSIRVISLRVASPVVAYMPPAPPWCRLAYIPTGVSRFSFLLIRVFQDLQTKDVRKAHTLCGLMGDIY